MATPPEPFKAAEAGRAGGDWEEAGSAGGDWHSLMQVLMQPPEARNCPDCGTTASRKVSSLENSSQWLVRRDGSAEWHRYFAERDADLLDLLPAAIAARFAKRCATHFSSLGERLVEILSERGGRDTSETRRDRQADFFQVRTRGSYGEASPIPPLPHPCPVAAGRDGGEHVVMPR